MFKDGADAPAPLKMLAATIEVSILSISVHRAITVCPACTDSSLIAFSASRSPLGQYQLRRAIAANRPCSDGTTGNAIQLHGPKLALDSANTEANDEQNRGVTLHAEFKC